MNFPSVLGHEMFHTLGQFPVAECQQFQAYPLLNGAFVSFRNGLKEDTVFQDAAGRKLGCFRGYHFYKDLLFSLVVFTDRMWIFKHLPGEDSINVAIGGGGSFEI